MIAFEVNFDSLVGPTHNYAGLAHGNLASQQHGHGISNPRAAALEGLAKMKKLSELGLKQGVFPPQRRPDLRALRQLGFSGTDAALVEAADRNAPQLLAACYSASSMWAANAATVSPSADTADGRVHITTANLVSQFHRSLEAADTAATLRKIFPESEHFAHHTPLPATMTFADEGAANHTRLARSHDHAGIELFTYGRSTLDPSLNSPRTFPARQTREASAAILRLNQLDPARAILLQQHPAAIDAGVFHNDVICVGNLNVLLCHEMAFAGRPRAIQSIQNLYSQVCGNELIVITASDHCLPLEDAVRSYVFNSQLVSVPDGSMILIAPTESAECESARRYIERIIAGENPVRAVHFVDLRQSMRNGGGPACLRLRIVLTESQLAATRQSVILTPELHANLVECVGKYYRDRLSPEDLANPQLIDESHRATDEVNRILQLS